VTAAETQTVVSNDEALAELQARSTGGAQLAPVAPSAMSPDVMRRLADAGYPVLIEDDVTLLRAAFAHTQKLYAAILDPRDYLYMVSYKEKGKTRQYVSKNRADADKFAETYKTEVSARPIKTGIVKLAQALGIEAVPESQGWFKDELGQHYYQVTYKAVHRRSGRTEYGIGACDRTERGGHIRTHDIITTADTRAYNRAILRLSGFGDVSGDEVIAAADGDVPDYVPETPRVRPMDDLPPGDADEVLTAARAWAEEIAKRPDSAERYQPPARQTNLASREMRAKARRGDAEAARKLGALGMKWEGPAQDGTGYPSFDVDASPVTPEEVKAAADASAAAVAKSAIGWDLSAEGSKNDDVAPPPPEDVPATSEPALNQGSPIPPPDIAAETITTKQAKNVSKLLLEIHAGNREQCGAWLQQNAHVTKSTQIRANQYEKIISALTAQKES
jgi:hypothetical protein